MAAIAASKQITSGRSGIKWRHRFIRRENDKIIVTVRSWVSTGRLNGVVQLCQVPDIQLKYVLPGLEELSEPEPMAGLVGHLDVSTKDPHDFPCVSECFQPRNALAVCIPIIDDEQARIK
jgi:hypothetical protein